MKRALKRHEAGEAIVIPVILRACDWHHAPFGKLLASPRDGKPVTQWPDRDEAFLQVAQAVRKVAETWQEARSVLGAPSASITHLPSQPAVLMRAAGPRSSNLRLAKTFRQRDKDQFQIGSFDYIARYFENSLEELEGRNPGYDGVFRRVGANRFFATVYKDGKDVARATIYMGTSMFRNGINYVQSETTESNSLNESFSVEADDQSLYLTSMGMSSFGHERKPKLSQKGAAELLWGMAIAPLQQGGGW